MALHKIATMGWLIPGDSPHYIPTYGYRGPYVAGRVHFPEAFATEAEFSDSFPLEAKFQESFSGEVEFLEVP